MAGLMAAWAQAAPVAAVILPPSITTSFGATYLPVNGVASLSFSIHNPNPINGLAGIGFTDTFPAGLQLDNGGAPINGCGGSLSATSDSVTLSGVSLAGGATCTITNYTVKDTVYGKTDNSVQVTSSSGTGNTSTASLIVAHPPAAGNPIFLGPSGTLGWVTAGTTVTLDMGIENPNTFTALSGVGFSATLPSGLTVANPNGLVAGGGCTADEITAVPGSHALSVAGVGLAANSGDPQNPDPNQSCGFDVKVVAGANGAQDVNTGPTTSNETSLTPGDPGDGVLPVFGAGPRIYWGTIGAPQTGRFQFARLDGSVGAALKPPSTLTCCIQGTAIDAAAGRLYGADVLNDVAPWTALDDSARGAVSMAGGGIQPNGLAIDPTAGKLYWASSSGAAIDYTNYKSASSGALYTSGDGNGATISSPSGVAIDAAAKRIYWTNASGGQPISYANLDGSGGGHDLSVTGASVSTPEGLVVDHTDGLVFWANQGSGKISYAHLNGSGGGDLTTTGATVASPGGLAFDPVTRRLWWGNVGGTSLGSVQLDATGTVASDGATLLTPGLSPVGPSYPSLLYPPHQSKAPTLTGSGAAGVKLTCSRGTWSGDILGDSFYRAPQSYAYRWQNAGVAIAGATSSTYTPSVNGEYTCTVTATNAAGKTTSTKSNVADAVAPTVSAPVGEPASGHPISTTVPVKLTWTGKDGGSGVDHYEVWLSTNGAAYVKVASPTSATYTRSMTPSNTTTYRFEVRGIDKAGNISGFAVGPTFHVELIDQTSSAVTWSGAWTTVSNTSASGGSYRYASASGASVSFTFTGRAVGVVGLLGTAYGDFEVWLDGTDIGPFSENNASTVWKELVYSTHWSSSASHTIKLVCNATSGHPRIDLDAFVVL